MFLLIYYKTIADYFIVEPQWRLQGAERACERIHIRMGGKFSVAGSLSSTYPIISSLRPG